MASNISDQPPSTRMFAPVMNPAPADARNTITAACRAPPEPKCQRMRHVTASHTYMLQTAAGLAAHGQKGILEWVQCKYAGRGAAPCMAATGRSAHTCSSAVLMRRNAWSLLAASTISSSGFCGSRSFRGENLPQQSCTHLEPCSQLSTPACCRAVGWAHVLQVHVHNSQKRPHMHLHS